MDALIVDLYNKLDSLKESLRLVIERLDMHCSDGAAHPHEHELNIDTLKEAVDGALSEAADAAIKEHEQEEHSEDDTREPETEPEPEPAPSPSAPEPEKEPVRIHPLHRRVG